jgi:hypothetical protein
MFQYNLVVLGLAYSAALFWFAGKAEGAETTTKSSIGALQLPDSFSLNDGKLTLPSGQAILNLPTELNANELRLSFIPFNSDPTKSVNPKLSQSTVLLSVKKSNGTLVGICRYQQGKLGLRYVPFFAPLRIKGDFESWRTYKPIEGDIAIAIDFAGAGRPVYYHSVWVKRNEMLKAVIPPLKEEGTKAAAEALARLYKDKNAVPESSESIARRQKVFKELKKKDEAKKAADAAAGPQK